MEGPAIFEVGTGNLTFTEGGPIVKDIEEDKPEGEIKEDVSTSDNPFVYQVESPTEEPKKDPSKDSEEQPEGEEESEEETDPFADYSDAAKYAEHYKEIGIFEEDFEVNKELSHEELLKSVYEQAKNMAVQEQEALYKSKYSEENLRLAEYLSQGGDPNFIHQSAIFEQLANAQAEDEEDKDAIILAMYGQQGIEPDDAQELLEIKKDKGLQDEEIKKARAMFKRLADETKEQVQVPQVDEEAVQAQIQERNQNIEKIVKGGKLGPFDLSAEKAQEDLLDFITNPKYVVRTQDQNGSITNKFVTGFDKAFGELMNSLEKQILLAKVLQEDFQFNSLKQEAERNAKTKVLDHLNRKKPAPKQTVKNAYIRE